MASSAFDTWSEGRASRLAQLLDAHSRIEGHGATGRRWRTGQFNRLLVLALASEFQGFCRDLHDECGAALVNYGVAGKPVVGQILLDRLHDARQLDRGNANPGSLGADFGRLGIELWPELAKRDERTQIRQAQLERLNKARNAIAHAQESDLSTLAHDGFPMTLRTYRSWFSSTSGLAETMDRTLWQYLRTVTGSPPW